MGLAALAASCLAGPDPAAAQQATLAAANLPVRVVTSSELGWIQGEDVGKSFAALLKGRLRPGDTLLVEDMYWIDAADLQLLPGMTIEGVNGGGFDVVTTPDDNTALFLGADGLTVTDLAIRIPGAPETGYPGTKPQPGEHYDPKRIFLLQEDARVTFRNTSFAGNVEMFIDAHNSPDLVIEDSSFEGGKYQVRLLGSTDRAVVTGGLFRHSLADGIKTEASDGTGPQNASITRSYFDDANRDGIDTAGGFKDGHIADSVFYANGIDLKVIMEKDADITTARSVNGTRIDNIRIIDEENAIVVTMLDRVGILTGENADTWMPHDILVTNSTIESTTGKEVRAFLIKDGYDIAWKNMTYLGNVSDRRLLNAEAPRGWSSRDVGGSGTVTGKPLCPPLAGRGRDIAAPSRLPADFRADRGCPVPN
ncbi:right-handed parallel beta-helix repeat-containing protein [Poseidonocella sp. HB161398]|uniref:right-handed parallel beta-helix repeat-containing protein n=1 Tax=Poseidonocella sp. HB161398 TaxID=2320855 RepID=UPI00110943C3|nr:right-handed parallel beta-helix repeat-containing protein [Poseidonocella sp. HB161398]